MKTLRTLAAAGALAALAFVAAALPASAAEPDSPALSRVLNAKSEATVSNGISDVRASALREIGESIGRRAGLADEGTKIIAETRTDGPGLDSRFVFSELLTPQGLLPPVISEEVDIVSVLDRSMRVAGAQYRIDAAARFVGVAPTWRDYLFLGLQSDPDKLVEDGGKVGYPRNDKEKAFWEKVVREGYSKGKTQAHKIFELNLARLERDYFGMRRFYELNQRGLVSMPVVASATDSFSRKDPNTVTIGETIFRITAPSGFQDPVKWKAKQ